jgi:hypothetical protein
MYPNYYSAQKVYHEQRCDEMRDRATRQLLRDAGLLRRGPVAHAACVVMCGLGGLLVRTGERLQQAVAAEASRAAMSGGANARLAG